MSLTQVGPDLISSIAGVSGGGKLIQRVYTSTGAYASTPTQIPMDDTIPQNTEGAELLTLAITPSAANSILMIETNVWMSVSGTAICSTSLFQDTTANALASMATTLTTNYIDALTMQHSMVAGTTSETTFKLRYGPDRAQTTKINGYSTTSRFHGGVASTTLSITEISA